MRSIGKTIAITAAGFLLLSGSANASDVEAELRQMQERIAELESQVGNETASFLAERESASGLSSILENTDMSGFAAASYNYNFEGFENTATTTNNVAPSHPTSNTFQVDQVQISIDNPADENGRGGAHVTFDAGNSTVTNRGGGVALYTAYASYLAPIGNGVALHAGLLPTLIGAEVEAQNGNFNVTRGQVWGLQPVTNVGATLGTSLTDEISVTIGVLNDSFAAGVADTNNEKSITGQLAWAGEDAGAAFNFSWGETLKSGGASPDDENTFIADVVLTYDGMEDISMWANYTLLSQDDGAAEGETHGIAVAARMALSDDMGVAIRGEAVLIDDDAVETETYSLTMTADKSLTDHLTAKAEVRLDFHADDLLPDDEGAAEEDVAAMILAQLLYEF